MRRWTLPLLLLANLGLALWLASLWFTPEGRLRALQWQPPPPLPPALDADQALPATGVELERYVATLEQPLFSPSRRPPPPQAASAAAPASDVPPELRVLGLYGVHAAQGTGEARGGMVARIDGQVKRVKIGDAVGRWTLKSLRPGEAVLALGDLEHVYPLQRTTSETPAPASASADNAPVQPSSSAAPRAPAANPCYRRQVDEARANVRRVNALRARSGLPPLPEP